jgi:hypothetical protein
MKKLKMKTQGKRNRTKGHNFERKLAKELREIGFNCRTSRYSSRETDDKCVDFVGTNPLSIQAKNTTNQPNFRKELDKMPKDENYNLVFHHTNRKDDIVVLYKDDFYQLIEMLRTEKII